MYEMVIEPALTPVTKPDVLLTEPIAVLLLLHVPPVVVQASVVDEPAITDAKPVIAAGEVLTDIVAVL
jgi:hypothetical protein